jgi:glycosyltransferase involved in cell wall biosynthesis
MNPDHPAALSADPASRSYADPLPTAAPRPPLRIAILAVGMRGGGGLTVGLNLVRSFGRVEPQNVYFCAVPPHLGYEEIAAQFPHTTLCTHEHRGLLQRWLFESCRLPRLVRDFAPDVVIALAARGLLRPGALQVAFPQDAHFYYPTRYFGCETLFNKLKKRYHVWHFDRQLRRTQLVLIQTAVGERRLRERFNYAGQTFVCQTSVTPALLQGRRGHPVPPGLRGLAGKFKLLYVTRYYAHKNLEAALPLFRDYHDDLQDVVLILTVSADQHANAPRFLRQIERCGLSRHIVNVGPIPHEQVGAYYEHADAFFMPTLLESFGIPYLEAMCFDLPILTSDLDFAHAVCGDAALFFDPWSPSSMRSAILQLKNDSQLRERLVAAGRARLRQDFPDWDTLARQVLLRIRCLHANQCPRSSPDRANAESNTEGYP